MPVRMKMVISAQKEFPNDERPLKSLHAQVWEGVWGRRRAKATGRWLRWSRQGELGARARGNPLPSALERQ